MTSHTDTLSQREREIMGNLALGKTRKEVSGKLYISEHTAITHTKNIYAKTGSHNLADITRVAIAKALGKTIHEIDKAIKKYLIDTTHPLRTILACSFLAIQILIIYHDMGDLTRARRTTKVAKVVKSNKAGKAGREDYYA